MIVELLLIIELLLLLLVIELLLLLSIVEHLLLLLMICTSNILQAGIFRSSMATLLMIQSFEPVAEF